MSCTSSRQHSTKTEAMDLEMQMPVEPQGNLAEMRGDPNLAASV